MLVRDFEGLQRGKKRIEAVHYEIVGRTGEAMIKTDGEKEGCDGEAGFSDGKQKVCLDDAQVIDLKVFACKLISFIYSCP
jgi:hypothetical protein